MTATVLLEPSLFAAFFACLYWSFRPRCPSNERSSCGTLSPQRSGPGAAETAPDLAESTGGAFDMDEPTWPPPPKVVARFWAKVDRDGPGGCWLWTASCTKGYGHLGFQGKQYRAHRFSYELLVGPIPHGLELDHLCRVRHCVNPEHLEPVTTRENLLRGETITARNAARTHCPQGHPYDEVNTLHYAGRRYCRACARHRMSRKGRG